MVVCISCRSPGPGGLGEGGGNGRGTGCYLSHFWCILSELVVFKSLTWDLASEPKITNIMNLSMCADSSTNTKTERNGQNWTETNRKENFIRFFLGFLCHV